MKNIMRNETAISPTEQSWVLLGSFLRDRESKQLLSAASAPLSETDRARMESFFRENESGHLQMIEKALAQSARNRLLHTTLPRMIRFAAICIAVLAVSLGIALAAVPGLREYVGKLFIQTTPQYTEITMQSGNTDTDSGAASLPVSENNGQIQVSGSSGHILMPKDWTGKNILTGLPESAEIIHTERDDISQVFYKTNPSSSTKWDISYSEYPGNCVIRIDTEDADLSTQIINGISVTAAEKEDLISVWWNDEDTIYVFQGQNITLQEALHYVRHIVPVN